MAKLQQMFRKSTRFSLTLLLLISQFTPMLLFTNRAYAAGAITFGSQFENQTFPNDPNTWTNGNLDNYSEGDYVNFRFQLTATDSTSAGKMLIEFDKGTCNFFTNYFDVVSATPAIATVTETTQTSGPQYYTQNLNVAFNSAGTTTVIFTLQLSNTAGECNGSNTAVRLGVPTDLQNTKDIDENGDFTNVGAKSLPMAANQVLENPSLTINKTVNGGTASADQFTFSFSPAISGVINGVSGTWNTVNLTNGTVTITEVNPDGQFVITENGPNGYVFSSGSGTNCVVTNPGIMTATVTADTDDPVDAVCNFTNQFQTGNIIIEKQTLPDGDPTSFSFTPSYGSNFSLSDGQTNNSGSLAPGTYSVSENVPAGWDLTNTVCSDGSSVGAISLQANETVTCTFTNTKRGQLIVQKTTLPAGDQAGFTVGVNTTNGSVIGDSQGVVSDSTDKAFTVTPGTYSVEETVPQGWQKTADTCQNVSVAAGETKYCTITNTKLVAITIIKDALPANDGTVFPFSLSTDPVSLFNLDDDANTQTPDSKTYYVLPGTYSITEDLSQLPWVLTNRDCGNKAFNELSNGISVTVTAGEVVSCTLTNTKFGSISGTKYEVNADGSLVNPTTGLAGWTIELYKDNVKVDETTTDSNGDYFFDMLMPGDYEVVEIFQNGWTQITPTGDGNHDITLEAGEQSTDNDFGNFQNGTIKGYKWNDVNGDGNVSGEPKLSGWTIFIDANNNQQLDNGELSDATDVNGNYEFSSLQPGTYTICEVQQAGWTQTFPNTQTGCSTTTIDVSGETVNRNFGNQGRGTIKVVKNVDENNDGDVTDPEDVTGATDWVWNINGSGSYVTGSTQNVPAGSHTVSEVQKDGYYVTYSSCSGETNGVVSTSLNVTVSPGENVVCTFTNAKKLGTLRVEKEVINNSGGSATASDFSFYFNDAPFTNYNFINDSQDDEAGYYEFVVVPGTYELSENEFEGYELISSTCDEVVVDLNQTATCKFVNDDKQAYVTVVKTVINDNGGKALPDHFYLKLDDMFVLSGVAVPVDPGTYTASESLLDGYTFEGYSGDCDSNGDVTVALGENKTCTLTNNDQQAYITLYKDVTNDNGGTAEPDDFNLTLEGDPVTSGVAVPVNPGTYTAGETQLPGYRFTGYSGNCDENGNITIALGEEKICTLLNNDISPKIIVTKYINSINEYDETFNFELINEGMLTEFGITLTYPETYDTYKLKNTLQAGEVSLEELDKDGWHEDYLYCNVEGTYADGKYVFNAEIGETYYCYVGNSELSDVVVTKINDLNKNGEWDEGEPTLSDWEMNLEKGCNYSESRISEENEQYCYFEFSSLSELTNEDGNAYFSDIKSGDYVLSETLKDGWVQTNIYCEENEIIIYSDNSLTEYDTNTSDFYIGPGETINCYVLNTKEEVDLEVDKDDAGVSTQAGAQYDYTIDVKNNSELFEAEEVTVTDVLDKNLKLVDTQGTDWTCSLVGQDANGFGGTVTCEYAKVLGTGESAPTLTFTVEVSANPTVTSIDNEVEVTSKQPDTDSSNNKDKENTPITKPPVLGEQTPELPKTGNAVNLSVIAGLLLVTFAIILQKSVLPQRQSTR